MLYSFLTVQKQKKKKGAVVSVRLFCVPPKETDAYFSQSCASNFPALRDIHCHKYFYM